MFGIGLPELILIMALALIVLGPDQLPKVAKQLARFVVDLKKASEEFKQQLDLEEFKEIKELKDLKNPLSWDLGPGAHREGHVSEGAAGPGGKDETTRGNPGGLGPEWREASGPAASDKGRGTPEKRDNAADLEEWEKDVVSPAGTSEKEKDGPEEPRKTSDQAEEMPK